MHFWFWPTVVFAVLFAIFGGGVCLGRLIHTNRNVAPKVSFTLTVALFCCGMALGLGLLAYLTG